MQLSKDIFDFMKQQWEEEQAEKAEEEAERMLEMGGSTTENFQTILRMAKIYQKVRHQQILTSQKK